MTVRIAAAVLALALRALADRDPSKPTWWDKYQYLSTHAPDASPGGSGSLSVGRNVDVSNECGPQSETFIAIDPTRPKRLAAGSNEIFRNPMRGYFSTDNGGSWGGVDLPLPDCKNQNGTCFGSDPSLAFDSRGTLYYSYIVVFFGNGNGVTATEMAVARSTDGGRTYPQTTFFALAGGSSHFNDKPMITADQNAGSPFRDNVYVAWDAAIGGSGTGGVQVATSSDGGATFSTARVDGPSGQGHSIGATVTTGPQGQVYVAWNDIAQNAIVFRASSPSRGSSSTSGFRPSRSAARWCIRPATRIDPPVPGPAGSRAPGWTSRRTGRTRTSMGRSPTTAAPPGRRGARSASRSPAWIASTTGWRPIRSRVR